MTNGRVVSNVLREFTFPDSGRVVHTRRIAPMLLRDLQRSFKPPKPPKQEVQFEKGVRFVPNASDPEYLEALEDYQGELGERIMRLVVTLGVVCEVPAEEVAALRATMTEQGITLDPSDLYVYISRICAQSNADLEALQQAVLGQSTVTEAGVEEAKERFPGDVPGH